jgi:non-heme chloroperoxidase
MRSPTELTARVADGVVLPYVEHGAGAPVVLLHGLSDNWRSFAPVLEHLPPGVRALAVTQRGHGDASKPPGGYEPRRMAADVVAFLDAVGADRAVLAGHSLGSAVALQAAVDAPERVAGLVLGAAHSAHRHATPALGELAGAVRALADPIDPAFARELQEQAREPHLPAGLHAAMVEQTLRMPARVWRAIVDGLSGFDVDAALPALDVPALLVWGEHDPFFDRATQEAVLRRLPGAELRVYAGGGHTPHWDDPARFAGDVAAVVQASAGLRRPVRRRLRG